MYMHVHVHVHVDAEIHYFHRNTSGLSKAVLDTVREDIGLHVPCGLPPFMTTGELTWCQFLHQKLKLCHISQSVWIVQSTKQGAQRVFTNWT